MFLEVSDCVAALDFHRELHVQPRSREVEAALNETMTSRRSWLKESSTTTQREKLEEVSRFVGQKRSVSQ